MRKVRGAALAMIAACNSPPADAPPATATATATAAAPAPAPATAPAPAPATAPAPAPATATAPATAAATAPATASAAPEPPPRVKVVTIGMHVGGGPYDDATKEPIKKSVEPHYAELARCWKYVTAPKQADVGVDLLIEADGGKAKVSNPRTTIQAEGFVPCVVSVFEAIDFGKPKNGRTGCSYSLRYTPN